MRFTRHFLVVFGLVAGLSVAGCGEEDTTEVTDPEETALVPEGKADNFFSLSAQEYWVDGVAFVELESSYATKSESARLDRVKQLIYYKQVAINWFLLRFVMGNDEHENKFQSLTKNGSYEDLEITQDATNKLMYSFRFRQEVGGQMDLLEELPTTTGQDGKKHFQLPVGKVSNTDLARLDINAEWYRSTPWSEFDATKVDASKIEYLDCTLTAEPRSSDAWIDYRRLFDDGELSISVHFGWDYHSEYHLKHSKDVYTWLTGQQGFLSPSSSYDTYTRTSGPLTKTIQADGKPVAVKIWLYWGQPGSDADPDTASGGKTLENDMREAFRSRDVVMFSGHSGPFYGFALANWRKTDEGDLDDSEIAGLEMPKDKYQVVLAEGCDTYAMGQAFWENPNKPNRTNLDVVTTTNFSNASTAGVVRNFILSLTEQSSGIHKPWKYSDLLAKLDGNSSWFHSMYGVHGIDDNPQLHPYGKLENLCTPCTSDAQCGGPGNKCTRLSGSEKVCTVECLTTEACPQGYECKKVATGSAITSSQCVPLNASCEQSEPPAEPGKVIINEVLADPASGSAGDANGDGTRSATADEFIEFVSASATPIDLSGWAVADDFGTRFVFPAGTQLIPGRAVVVFGGGNAAKVRDFKGLYGTLAFLSGGLGLSNTGDTVKLVRPDGSLSDSVTYGADANKDRSLVRQADGDPTSPFVQHPATAFSAGTKSDGTKF